MVPFDINGRQRLKKGRLQAPAFAARDANEERLKTFFARQYVDDAARIVIFQSMQYDAARFDQHISVVIFVKPKARPTPPAARFLRSKASCPRPVQQGSFLNLRLRRVSLYLK